MSSVQREIYELLSDSKERTDSSVYRKMLAKDALEGSVDTGAEETPIIRDFKSHSEEEPVCSI